MGLQGNLQDFEITDILQLIYMGQKVGVLRIITENDEGEIYFDSGLVVHAKTQDKKGQSAIQTILRWTKGSFVFDPEGKMPEEKTIQLPVQNVILEAARQIDEWKGMEKIIPSMDVIVDFVPEPDMSNIELNQEEWRVLTAIDGEKTAKEIAEKLNLKEFETARILYGLISSGLLKVINESPEKKEERRGGFFRKR